MTTQSNKTPGRVQCSGEAHHNVYIDHCGECMPYWGSYPVCPECGRKLRTAKSGRRICDTCHISYHN